MRVTVVALLVFSRIARLPLCFEATIAIDTGEVIEGRLPPRALGLVQEWREHHKAELAEDWNLARERKPLRRIDPLE